MNTHHGHQMRTMSSKLNTERIDWPLWWFARLEAAIERGDYEAAAKAQRNLERLGVRVRYTHPDRREVFDGR